MLCVSDACDARGCETEAAAVGATAGGGIVSVKPRGRRRAGAVVAGATAGGTTVATGGTTVDGATAAGTTKEVSAFAGVGAPASKEENGSVLCLFGGEPGGALRDGSKKAI